LLALGDEERIRGDDERIGALLVDQRKSTVYFGCGTCIYNVQLTSIRACGCLRVLNLNRCIPKCGVNQHANNTSFGHQFEYQFQPLLCEWRRDQAYASGIAAGSVVARNESRHDGIKTNDEDDRNGRRRRLCGQRCGRCSGRNDSNIWRTNSAAIPGNR
jgi:hypothetical protein